MMLTFSNQHITIASEKDVSSIKKLLDSAYRGETSKKGWTTEAHLITGNTRTDESTVAELIKQHNSVFLKYMNEQNEITGCVNLQQHKQKIYLGMFSVLPLAQGSGIGKQLLTAAEEYAKQLHCNSIYMTVISVRTELINWYKRHSYKDTGVKNFFEEDELSGKHVQPLEFIVLEKVFT